MYNMGNLQLVYTHDIPSVCSSSAQPIPNLHVAYTHPRAIYLSTRRGIFMCFSSLRKRSVVGGLRSVAGVARPKCSRPSAGVRAHFGAGARAPCASRAAFARACAVTTARREARVHLFPSARCKRPSGLTLQRLQCRHWEWLLENAWEGSDILKWVSFGFKMQ